MNNEGICTRSASPIQRTHALQKYWNFPIPAHPVVDAEDLSGCIKQIENELDELIELQGKVEEQNGFIKEDVDELSDTCIDLLEYIQQLIVRCGLVDRIEEDSYKIYLNNCTKVCKDMNHALETQQMYDEMGINTVIDYSMQFNHFIVKDAETNHVKKPKGFIPVKL